MALEVNIDDDIFLPCYLHILNAIEDPKPNDIDFLYGGRDSGKSKFIAQLLILLCMKLSYFRCVLIKSVFNTIKDSQWQMLKDVVDEWGVSDLFVFTQSPLEIRCINGNKFICRGMDEPGRLKSIANPSHAWVEEGNQLTFDAFILLMTSLRYNQGRCHTYFSFNPEVEDGDYQEFWLYKTFYSTVSDIYSRFTSTWSMEISPGKMFEYRYQSTHTTFHDNKYCTPERIVFFEKLKDIDPYHYQVFTLGKWGNRKSDDPYCMCFDPKKHVGPTALDRRQVVYLSFDYNVNPITCGVYQHHQGIRAIEAIQLANSDIYKLCDHLIAAYQGCIFEVTGDATGQNTTALVQDGINYYTVIKSKLNLMTSQLKVPTINPKVKENRVLVNAAFTLADVKLDPDKCKALIFDCKNVSVTDIGDIDKGSRSNPKKRADHLDHFRYYLNTFHKHILKM